MSFWNSLFGGGSKSGAGQRKRRLPESELALLLFSNYGLVSCGDRVSWRKDTFITPLEASGNPNARDVCEAIKAAAHKMECKGMCIVATNPTLIVLRTERAQSYFSTSLDQEECDKFFKMMMNEYRSRGQPHHHSGCAFIEFDDAG
jgi:hypothetical protein